MTLLLRNLQKAVSVNVPKLKQDVQSLRRIMHVQRFDVAVLCVDDNKIQELNKMYRGVDKVTDVLSFPANEIQVPGRLPDPWSDLADLGDIFLGMPYIYNQCVKDGTTIEAVLPAIITHGFCHLMGFDHENKEQWLEMRAKEVSILEKFNKITGNGSTPLATSWS
ncbi:putative ribonuclease [Apostichopus japonicus]|uniref:Putative ribonuclease n=1 Tax=Stichopus japonicus TaxID=307972 RepID=A0A2G8KN17_STIJA|nr:putative ribonuclease [Apostichopus japonicus]